MLKQVTVRLKNGSNAHTLVDDEPVADVVERYLRRKGFQVLAAFVGDAMDHFLPNPETS